MKHYWDKSEVILNFRVTRLVKQRNIIKAIGGSTAYLDRKIKALEERLRRD